MNGSAGGSPLGGFSSVSQRTYKFAFDASAEYVLTAVPEDQWDWNKLPGLSDCGNSSLAKNGLMWAWRWRPDLELLEVNAYWNNDSTHLWPDQPLFTLTRAELAAGAPLTYSIGINADSYSFSVSGTINGRAINASTTARRACPNGSSLFRWASGLYFGGTSTAPHPVTGKVFEIR
jgi:hypothetical protein